MDAPSLRRSRTSDSIHREKFKAALSARNSKACSSTRTTHTSSTAISHTGSAETVTSEPMTEGCATESTVTEPKSPTLSGGQVLRSQRSSISSALVSSPSVPTIIQEISFTDDMNEIAPHRTEVGVEELCKKYGVLSPDSLFRARLDTLLVLVTMYFTIILPVQIAFFAEESHASFIIHLVLDCLYFMDIFLNFVTAFRPTYENLLASGVEEEITAFLVFKRSRIAQMYLRGQFVPDLILSLPVTDLWVGAGFDCCTREQAEALQWPRSARLCCRIIRCWRILRLDRVWLVLSRLSSQVGISVQGAHVARFALGLLLVVHWTACAFYSLASCDWRDDGCYYSDIEALKQDHCGIDGRDCVFRSWVATFYLMIILVNGESYPLRWNTSSGELVFVIAVIIGGTVMLGIVFGQVGAALQEYSKQQRLNDADLRKLQYFLTKVHLEPQLQQQVLEFFQVQLNLYKSEQVLQRDMVTSKLNDSLRGNLELYLKSSVISEIPLVSDLVRDSKLVAMHLCTRMWQRTYLASDVLGHKHTLADHLSLLLVGAVARKGAFSYANEVSLSEGPVVLFAGTLFLDVALYAETVSARAHCENYELHCDDFKAVQEEFPHSCSHLRALKSFEKGLQEFADTDPDVISPDDLDSDTSDSEDDSKDDSDDEEQPNSSAQDSTAYFFAAQRKMHDPKRAEVQLRQRRGSQDAGADMVNEIQGERQRRGSQGAFQMLQGIEGERQRRGSQESIAGERQRRGSQGALQLLQGIEGERQRRGSREGIAGERQRRGSQGAFQLLQGIEGERQRRGSQEGIAGERQRRGSQGAFQLLQGIAGERQRRGSQGASQLLQGIEGERQRRGSHGSVDMLEEIQGKSFGKVFSEGAFQKIPSSGNGGNSFGKVFSDGAFQKIPSSGNSIASRLQWLSLKTRGWQKVDQKNSQIISDSAVVPTEQPKPPASSTSQPVPPLMSQPVVLPSSKSPPPKPPAPLKPPALLDESSHSLGVPSLGVPVAGQTCLLEHDASPAVESPTSKADSVSPTSSPRSARHSTVRRSFSEECSKRETQPLCETQKKRHSVMVGVRPDPVNGNGNGNCNGKRNSTFKLEQAQAFKNIVTGKQGASLKSKLFGGGNNENASKSSNAPVCGKGLAGVLANRIQIQRQKAVYDVKSRTLVPMEANSESQSRLQSRPESPSKQEPKKMPKNDVQRGGVSPPGESDDKEHFQHSKINKEPECDLLESPGMDPDLLTIKEDPLDGLSIKGGRKGSIFSIASRRNSFAISKVGHADPAAVASLEAAVQRSEKMAQALRLAAETLEERISKSAARRVLLSFGFEPPKEWNSDEDGSNCSGDGLGLDNSNESD